MALELYPWIHPETGQKRWYFNAWREAIGLKAGKYPGDFVTLRGKMGENLAAEKIKMSAWFDEQKNLHLDYFEGAGMISQDKVRRDVEKHLALYGGLELLD
ncbi:hypothetical protein [Rothia mucilaginosa]|jgi:hypothetical protein|uniref:hypothetical protein n=1 Tax=Rothia mucilaginosa TaxID=43675 RepID=UPI0028DC4178|nr:hypothetical protein [Rothia mucilaginosa]